MALHHPPKDQLIAFGQGTLASVESSHIEQHLEVCHECCETLLDLKDDTFVGLVKTASARSADPANVRTDPGTDARSVRDNSVHASTIIEPSGESTAPEELPPELAGHLRYDIVEQIGRGGMGNVYRAGHRLMNRPVAIKLINSQLMQNPHAVERFRREVQAAAKLSHPNIVAAYDAEQAGNSHFLVMEFVEGTDLDSVVIQRGPMSVAEACECIRQVAMGLQHAYEKGMVHRDIKPHNLMLAAGGQVRILDFGLAGFVTEAAAENTGRNALASDSGTGNAETDKPDAIAYRLTSAAHLTMAGTVMGTPDYIAPEQATDAHSADIRADIYSLGCTLHFLLTGKPPFAADNVLMKLKAHAELMPESLTKLRDDVPQELSNVVARMMAKKPAERFQTPAAVAEALAPFAKPAALSPRRRVRTLVAALCMGVAALLAGVIFVQTSKGRVEIQSEVDDVEIVIKRGGEQIDVLDTKTGSQIKWLPSGEYEIKLKGDRNDVEIKGGNFTLSRWGKAIVTLKLKKDASGITAKPDWNGWPKDTPSPGKPKPPQSRVGLLTNPPKLPPEGLPVGRNLIVDPSLEQTPTGQLPNGWFAWLDDGPDFKCEVVEGGVTGKHCLQISGTGTRGVVFATSIPLDRTKRYALKGHVKVEGDAGTWAVIKLNYFNDTGWLGVDDRIGVTSSDLDWKLLEKTDLAEKYPTATLLVPTCHIEGNGTAWFDNLEVVACDRDKLPADFDAKHGRNNRMK